MKKSTVVVGFLLVVAAALTLWMLYVSGPALTDPYPSPDPSASAAPAPAPVAPPELVTWALKQRGRALRARRPLARADRCLRLHVPPAVDAAPDRSSDAATWKAYGRGCQVLASHFRETLKTRLHKMCHPGLSASGTKWLPLARWVGWPRSTWHTLAALIWNESSGIPWEPNQQGSGCDGLLQLADCWTAGRNPFDPLVNLTIGLHIWRLQHGSFLPAWQGDPAVSR